MFLMRSCLLIGLYYFEEKYNISRMHNLNLAVVLLIGAAADLASYSVGDQFRSSTIRGWGIHPAIQFIYSYIQVGGISLILYGHRRCSILFFFAFIVQLQPFFLTLSTYYVFDGNDIDKLRLSYQTNNRYMIHS